MAALPTLPISLSRSAALRSTSTDRGVDPARRTARRSRAGLGILLSLSVLLTACATFEAPQQSVTPEPASVQSRTLERVTVSAAILTDQQATANYGVDLASQQIQAIWLRIENRSEREMWLLMSSLDPKTGEPTRVRRKRDQDGTVERIAVKSGQSIVRNR